jgi:hypothetical protein
MKHDDPRLAGRVLEGKLVFGLVALIAMGIAAYAVVDFILPAFAQIEAAFHALPVSKN